MKGTKHRQSAKDDIALSRFDRLEGLGAILFGLCFIAGGAPLLATLGDEPIWVFICGVTFASWGVGVVVVGIQVHRDIRREVSLRMQYPGQPWRWRDDWANGRIPSGGGNVMALAFFFFFLVLPTCLMVSLQVWAGLEENEERAWVWLFVLAFVAVATWLSWIFVRRVLTRRWGDQSFFSPTATPLPASGPVSGNLTVPRDIRSAGEICLRLSCERSREAADEEEWESVWEDERVVPTAHWTPDPDGCWRVPVHFDVPNGLPGTRSGTRFNKVRWELEAKAKTPHGRYREVFELPVFAEGASPPDKWVSL